MTAGIFLFSCLYFYFPVALANIGANIAKFIPFFNTITHPVDGGITYRGSRLVGPHKNWGAFLFGVLFGTGIGIVKVYVLDRVVPENIHILSLPAVPMIILYLVMSAGALTGDIIKSIAKRLLGRPAHSPWIPFDEIDHSTVSLLIARLFFPIPWEVIGTVILIFGVLHAAANVLGYWMKVKDVPY